MPFISVVIPTHNRERVLERAIQSVLNQTFGDFELIVVDDGSTDSTGTLLSKYKGRLRGIFQSNRGVAAARNLGILSSQGKLIAFLDSDDEWMPEKLTKQIALFHPGRESFICHTDEIWLRNGKIIFPRRVHRKQGGFFFVRALERCLISPSAALLSRSLLNQVGLFDESLPAAEDYDLWLRITAFHEVKFVPETLVIKHGGGVDQLSRTIPAIDRFRITAILKILDDQHLRHDYRQLAIRELIRKCGIVATGLRKRGKIQEADAYYELARTYQVDCVRSK